MLASVYFEASKLNQSFVKFEKFSFNEQFKRNTFAKKSYKQNKVFTLKKAQSMIVGHQLFKRQLLCFERDHQSSNIYMRASYLLSYQVGHKYYTYIVLQLYCLQEPNSTLHRPLGRRFQTSPFCATGPLSCRDRSRCRCSRETLLVRIFIFLIC